MTLCRLHPYYLRLCWKGL